MELSILYRGPLASCNYGCGYCPFAKRPETVQEKRADTAALHRFETWVTEHDARRLAIFFTPWGEALHQQRYRDSIVRLSHLPHVRRVAAQTNNAGHPGWLAEVHRDTVALWTTYHPGQTSRERFLYRCRQLDDLGIRYSVGMVAAPWLIPEVTAFRAELPSHVPFWLNGYSRSGGAVNPGTYEPAQVEQLTDLDPTFPLTLSRLRTRGRPCRAGSEAISVDGDGAIRRCHFTSAVLGNLYTDDLQSVLTPKACPRSSCPCHLGRVNLPQLGAEKVYGAGLLERIVEEPSEIDPMLVRAATW